MLRQIIISIGSLKISKDFITRYRLWDNWQNMRWIYTSSILVALYFGVKMFGLIGKAISKIGDVVTGNLDTVSLGFSGGALLSDWSFVRSDTYKYIFLFFTMSLVYHFGGRAVEILYGIPYRPTFSTFVKSQIRTFFTLLVCYVLEQVFVGISTGILGMTGGSWLTPVVKFMIQSFLFGAVIIDGLHDVRGASIKQGIKHSFDFYPGIALVFGAIGLLISYVPLLGSLAISSVLTVGILIAIKRVEAGP
nr:hypothetical protein [Saprospiraceae bacterium]